MQGREIHRLISMLSRFPGVGPRSARRLTVFWLKKKEAVLRPFIQALTDFERSVQLCPQCFSFDTQIPCAICSSIKRDFGQICVVGDVMDIWALERSEVYNGLYHVLGGVLSAVDGVSPKDLRIQELVVRLQSQDVCELIFALPPTVDGQMTLHYVLEQVKSISIQKTTLGQGVPIGGEFDFLDNGTLSEAFRSRKDLGR